MSGPLRMATGPTDHDGLGRERFWDQTPEDRAAALSVMVADAGIDLSRVRPAYWPSRSADRAFARGWLAEHQRAAKRSDT